MKKGNKKTKETVMNREVKHSAIYNLPNRRKQDRSWKLELTKSLLVFLILFFIE